MSFFRYCNSRKFGMRCNACGKFMTSRGSHLSYGPDHSIIHKCFDCKGIPGLVGRSIIIMTPNI